MKFAYPEMSTVSHNGRWYDTPHGYYPSITTILGATEAADKKESLQRWRDGVGHEEADRISTAAIERGTNVHLLCERYFKNEIPIQPGDTISDEDIESFTALRLNLKKVSEVWGQEVALYSKEVEIAGRCDLVGVYKGRPVIIDFKTSTRLKHDEDIGNYKVQLCFYATAHNEMFGTNIEEGIILMVAETGFPMEFKIKIADYLPELKRRASAFWLAAINSSMQAGA